MTSSPALRVAGGGGDRSSCLLGKAGHCSWTGREFKANLEFSMHVIVFGMWEETKLAIFTR